ncbi:MAG: ATP-binding cassette domain-containing protein [Bifidobacteriaceae bacterium]|jgi:NitT/TauT family transport system ATP-binding protein|nr:ATP-binding cassette domain-containing protein [Bifidobacteriaceae bacterium]
MSDVSFAYGEEPVLCGINVQASALAVTGANGSGKTTLLKLVLGLLRPASGTVSAPARKAAVFQDDRLIEHLTAVANVRVAHPGKITDRDIAAELRAVGLPEEVWLRPVRDLSGGQRRRVALARAVAPGAELVCLDEPFTGVDADSLPALRAHIRDRLRGRDVAIATHSEHDIVHFGATRLHLS